jgi:hypothetical protein
VLVTLPPAEAFTVAFGALKLTVFGKLKNSARNDKVEPSVTWKFLKSDASY